MQLTIGQFQYAVYKYPMRDSLNQREEKAVYELNGHSVQGIFLHIYVSFSPRVGPLSTVGIGPILYSSAAIYAARALAPAPAAVGITHTLQRSGLRDAQIQRKTRNIFRA